MITARILGRTRIGVLVRNGHRVCDACLISGLFYTSARHSPGERVMATDLSFVEFISEQAALGARISHKKMFGEYAIYVDTKMVGLACDNSLFVKPTAMTSDLTAGLPVRGPYPGAKPHPVVDELLDEPDRLRQLLLATAACMPEPKLRAPKKTTKSKRSVSTTV
ncbi:MAG: hypothetical protein BWZ07_01093 [Alphaproteobacteria bacterium ADurb.BinA280]|nr:MAG: hypothetical protein BWZ07_01093 [Alphaproteobacteria bacterium ADurb.BinA280]